ncbi:hypothetical protein FACS189475_08230 [Betaproteobacteria bacterium]|nr:hypothetical protein FACS189475_08230 [Betaproteobacteria bacterium]
MKQDAVTKMYEGLTGKERAVLSFHYLTRQDELESERIGHSGYEFQRWINSIADMAALFGLTHWRLMAGKFENQWCLKVALSNKKDASKAFAMMNNLKEIEGCLMALDAALLAVCQEHGIDPDDVRRMAEQAEPFVSNIESKLDEEFLEKWKTNLSKPLPA